MEFLIAIIPSVCWGSLGLLSTKFGGNTSQQTLGLTYGGLFFGIICYVCWVLPRNYYIDSKIVLIGMISGVLWTIGQAFQFLAIKSMRGVSVAVPLSMTSQLVGNALLGAAVLGEWQSWQQWLAGIIAIALIVLGALMIQKKDASDSENSSTVNKKGILQITISTLGFMGYFIAPRLMQGWMSVPSDVITAGRGVNYMVAIIFPQSVGMVIGAYLYVFLISHEAKHLHATVTWKNAIVGVVWAIGNIAMFVSIANPRLGQAVATTLSQLGFIVGAFGGILFLHEHKSALQMRMIVGGSVLALLGAVLISNINWFANML